jgi:hypothetical protein
MAPIPWYYMWSERYKFFSEIMKHTANQPEFALRPIHVPQERFDDELYKKNGEHFWYGSLIKVDMVINSLVECAAKGDQYLLFTDIDIIVKPGVYDAMKPYIEGDNDMIFFKEGSNTNIGFILLKVSESVITFWKTIRAMMIEKEGLDQVYIHQMLDSYPGKWTHFDNQIFAFTNTWDGFKPFVIMQLSCSRIGADEGLEKEFNMAERVFLAAQHMEIESYMKYVTLDVIPFIYRFQEIYIRSHQQAKNDAVNS